MAVICVDAMGGDEPPEVVLEGIAAALDASAELEVLVAGTQEVVEPFVASHERARALLCSQTITMAEHPVQAVRKKRDSSIVKGCQALRKGDADAFFSAGSTGAILAAGTLFVGRIKGVIRPALAAVVPGLDGASRVMLDLGANADCRSEMIVQFALMGQVMAQKELGVAEPTVALLSNGTEDTKGSESVRAFHKALEKAKAQGVNFGGNCEGSDILLGAWDVIVCDGFTGNVALKSMEGTAKYLARRLKTQAQKNLFTGVGGLLIKNALGSVAKDLSGDEHGGAVLLGLRAPVFVGHGATSKEAIEQGTLAAERSVARSLAADIAQVVA